MSRRAARLARGDFGRVEAGGVFYAAVMVLVAAIAAWPVYADVRFLVVVLLSVTVAALIAVFAHRLMWTPVITAVWTIGALLVIGLTVVVPLSGNGLVRGLTLFFGGLVTSWKDLVTVDLPVGGYRNLLVPALVVFVVGTVVGLLLSWSRTRAHLGAVLVFGMMTWFGLLFGSDRAGAAWQWNGFAMPPLREALLGLVTLGASLAWLVWRSRIVRSEALRHAAHVSGVQLTRPHALSVVRVTTLGLTLVVVAVAVSVVATPVVLGGSTRQVLRSGVQPEQQLATELTPLEVYRNAFSDANYQRVLFTVGGSAVLPDRVRLATLTDYDGETFTASGTDYRRLPAYRDPGAGQQATITITSAGSGTVWLPSAGSLASVTFTGDRASQLSDGFYYDPASGATIDTVPGGLAEGDSYTAQVAIADPVALSELSSPGRNARFTAPDSLVRWVKLQNQDSSGAGLAELARRLTARGYLSHSLTATDPVPAWVGDLGGGYQFRASTAGHSLARLTEMFDALLARQQGVSDDPESTALVGAVGDDEQFAVAIALIADQLGFPARVVVGARLSGNDDGIPSCAGGECRGKNLSAWVEVQGSDGRWAAVDATPQHEVNPDQKVEDRRDPQNRTQVRPLPANEVDPPDVGGSPGAANDPPSELNLAWLWPILHVSGIVAFALLLLLGPLMVIVVAKALRRRHRRRNSQPALRMVGGWEELVDARADAGEIVPEKATRTEMATVFGDDASRELAAAVDRAVFGGVPISGAEADIFWNQVETERQRTARRGNVRQRMQAAMSLTSFFRGVRAGEGRRRLSVSEQHG